MQTHRRLPNSHRLVETLAAIYIRSAQPEVWSLVLLIKLLSQDSSMEPHPTSKMGNSRRLIGSGPEVSHNPKIRVSDYKHELFIHVRKNLDCPINDLRAQKITSKFRAALIKWNSNTYIISFICQEYFTFISTFKWIDVFAHLNFTYFRSNNLIKAVT